MTAYLNQGVKAKMCETTPTSTVWERHILLQEHKLRRPVTLFEGKAMPLALASGCLILIHPASPDDNLIAGPSFVQTSPTTMSMPKKKDSISALAAIKEALTICQDRNLHQITGSRVARIYSNHAGWYRGQRLSTQST